MNAGSLLAIVGLGVALAVGCGGPAVTAESSTVARGTPDGLETAPATVEPEAAPPVEDGVDSAHDRFAAECAAGLARARALLPGIVDVAGERTVGNTVEPYNELLMHLENAWGKALLWRSVHPDERMRELAKQCEADASALHSELGLDRGLYQAFAALPTEGLDAETARLVAHRLRDFRRSGVDKADATRARLKAIDEEMTVVSQAFSTNIAEDTRFIEVESAERLAGLPADWIAAHKPGENGKIRITTDYPDYLPFIKYARDAELRRQLYVAFKARAGDENPALLQRLLELRTENARLLGHDDWADYITEDKMIGSGENARQFIARVVALAKKRAASDYKQLLARKRKDVPRARRVHDYDKGYYSNKIAEEDYAVDPDTVRAYFAYDAVQTGLLDITSEIYGIEYRAVKDAPVWHESVDVFDVLRDGEVLGRIFLDMHPREGKYKHAAQFPLRSGVLGVQKPEGALVCNFPDPDQSEGPALMEHGQVETMFHEFGHLMHHVLGGQRRYVSQSGVATERDFVEAPSQMFEEWAWNYETLARFARHHETGEVIPRALVDKMRRADQFGRGIAALQQMFYASLSLELHRADPRKLDQQAVVKRLQESITPFEYVSGTSFQANFGHLNGYSAMYYTYMWSLVIAKDLASPFLEHGLMNKEWTTRYRDRVLAPGGSKDAADLVEDFLGRPYRFDAFERWLSGK